MSPARRGSATCSHVPAMALEERHGIRMAQSPGSLCSPSSRAPLPPRPLVSRNMSCWTQSWAQLVHRNGKKILFEGWKDNVKRPKRKLSCACNLCHWLAGQCRCQVTVNLDQFVHLLRQLVWNARPVSRLLVEEGKAWDGQRKLVFEIRHGLHWRRIFSFEELFATLTYPQTMKSESKEGLEPGLSIREEQNSRGGSSFAKRAQSPFDFANLNHKFFRARTVWIQAHKARGSLEKLPILAHLQFKLTPGRWGGVQINIRNCSLMGQGHFFQWTKVIFLTSHLHCIPQTELKIAVKKNKKRGSPNPAAMNKIYY